MPILTLQKEAGQIGRIRLGHSVDTGKVKNGRAIRKPVRDDCFRFTTHSDFAAHAVAELLGGEARPWTVQDGAPTAGQWQVATQRDQINVIVPPGPKAVDSWYEMWLPKMCVRRCDGEVEQKSGSACLCPADQEKRAAEAQFGRACKMTTRVNVMIPDLPGVGVWMLESHGFYAATEMTGVAEMLAAAGEYGVKIPARLRIEQRERRVYQGENDKPLTKKFPVPVLEVLATLREITAAASGGQQLSLAASMPPAIEPARAAISAGPAKPAPAAGPTSAPAQVLADRAVAAKDKDELRAVWREAGPSLRDEWVTVPQYAELLTLDDVINERNEHFDSQGGTA